MSLVSSFAPVAGALAALAASGCVTSRAAPGMMSGGDVSACQRHIWNAAEDVWFTCALQSADQAHREAGRQPIGNKNCFGLEPCAAPDKALIIRLLVNSATFSGKVPESQSIEITRFDDEHAQVEVRDLFGTKPYVYREDMPLQRSAMRRGATSSRQLSPEATRRILELAGQLRQKPEAAAWTVCVRHGADPQDDVLTLLADGANIFVQLFFDGEEHAYQRNSAFYGKAGEIAYLVLENEIPDSDNNGCAPS